MNIRILSERGYQTWPSYQICFEWEDDIAEVLDCPVYNIWNSKFLQIVRYIRKAFWKVQRLIGNEVNRFKYTNKNNLGFIFIMNASTYQEFVFKDCIPIFLDFPVKMVNVIIKATVNCPFFIVTCYQIFVDLQKCGCTNVVYMPLSVPTKYITDKLQSKEIDVLQVGRANQKLHGFMLDYCNRHPDVEYVYSCNDPQNQLKYVSTLNREIGKIESRADYIKLLSSCKVSLVSSPGAEGDNRMGDIDFITPRFYESASKYCHMIARYSDMEETKMIGLREICRNVNNQKEFDDMVTELLSKPCEENIEVYKDFLARNNTKVRAQYIKDLIKNI